MSHTFLHVPQLHWIVVEDSSSPTPLVTNFLAGSGLTYTHLHMLTPKDRKLQEGDPHWLKPRGAEQRNEGLRWLREKAAADGGKASNFDNAVIYFADDDNTYSLQLFEEVSNSVKIRVGKVVYSVYVKFAKCIITNTFSHHLLYV